MCKAARHGSQGGCEGMASHAGGQGCASYDGAAWLWGHPKRPSPRRRAAGRRWCARLSRRGRPVDGWPAHGCHGVDQACRAQRITTTSGLSAGIATVPGGGPALDDDTQRGAAGRTAGRPWELGLAPWWRVLAGGFWHAHPAEGGAREGTARREQAAVADCQKEPLGQRGCRKRRSNSRTSRGAVRRCARPPCREGQVTVRSWRETRRRLALAPWQT